MMDGDNRVGAFDLAHARMARADEARRAELDRLIAAMGNKDDRGEQRCADCHQQLPRNATSMFCKRCIQTEICPDCGEKKGIRSLRCPRCYTAKKKRAYRAKHRERIAAAQAEYKRKRQEAARKKLAARGIEVTP